MPDEVLSAVGLITLIVCGNLLVRGSAWTATVLGIRPIIVGLTVVAFGTSAPELAAALTASLADQDGLATGTVFGSNIGNIGLILGLTALYRPLTQLPGTASFEVRCLLLITAAAVLPVAFGDHIDRWMGVSGLVFLATFTWLLAHREVRARGRDGATRVRVPWTWRQAAYNGSRIVGGLVGLQLGAGWLVDGASGIAMSLGISEQVIGSVFIAVGTSLPELAASLVAARKRHAEMALGNILGSNMFNLTMVLGGTAVVRPLSVSWAGEGLLATIGLGFTAVLAGLLGFAHGISRIAGAILFVGFLAYVVLLVAR